MKYVQYDKRNGISKITLNRPEAMNCFNYAFLLELEEIVDQLRTDRETRIVIFTGSGEKAFSAGADLKERKTLNETEVRRNVLKIRTVFDKIADLPMPTIAAINGYAFGGGFELVLACDFKIAAETAMLGLTETSWGIIPGAGGTQRLTRLIGEMRAKELIFTARKITALEAFHCGILTKVVSQHSLIPACERLAEEIMKNAPIAIKQAKFAIQQGVGNDMKSALNIEQSAYELTIPTRDRLEALEAFSQKRRPIFKGE